MTTTILTLLSALAIHAAPPPDSVGTMSRKMDLGVQVADLDQGLVATEKRVAELGVAILNSRNNREAKWNRTAFLKLSVPDSLFDRLRTSLAALGTVTQSRLEVVNTRDDIERLEQEVKFRKSQREAYAKELPTIDRSKDAEVYHKTWEKTRSIDESIFELERRLLEARQKVRENIVELTLSEASEPPSQTSRAWVEFTNMPGGEFTYLSVENPKSGVSNGDYMGGSVRYLFTRGKSYVVLGVLKNSHREPQDSTVFTDIFQYAYGADFYPSHFGRGQRNFLNLYSGFTIGGLFLSSKSTNRNLFQVAPHIGIELYKGRRVLLDTRGGYLLPLSSKYNLNLRGWTSSTSINFVF